MVINFVGNFQKGYVGEVSDETHLARELEALGHTVIRVPRDVWKAYCDGDEVQKDWVLPKEADFNLICKWNYFNDKKYVLKLKELAPVFYWVWDYMYYNELPNWHIEMVQASDLYLGNDVRDSHYDLFNNCYYFPFDCYDNEIKINEETIDKIYDVVFFGSWIEQGDRQAWLTEINKTNPVTVFSWNHQDWPKEFTVKEAVYGDEFTKVVRQSKIILGFSVEPNTWGYWSNRVGKVLGANGFLLYQYAPGMELFLSDGAEYFSTIEEAREKIDHYLIADFERMKIAKQGTKLAKRFTSKERIKELIILAERFLKGHKWQI